MLYREHIGDRIWFAAGGLVVTWDSARDLHALMITLEDEFSFSPEEKMLVVSVVNRVGPSMINKSITESRIIELHSRLMMEFVAMADAGIVHARRWRKNASQVL